MSDIIVRADVKYFTSDNAIESLTTAIGIKSYYYYSSALQFR